ncbi:nuclear transport factor 2 family protein [Granulosicoccus antarcticus]|uniref:SnoaL-like domain-containing protein n=1 Tax=Granulosicoccus antarcticus IMCC3135 TaxID=1192854 RepID=A0A2Z2NTT1_9GAMM|nr:nuclear transport factor 2 family protein [Granulosicoccus antarcticus]ASJ73148.1 hypothetical protein IMCC3135_15320 [Granulosicoccus antarcticus IMCC3135]
MNIKTVAASLLALSTFSAVAYASDANQLDANKQLVTEAINAMFVDFDPVATGNLLAEDYIQHNPAVPTGAAAIIGFLPALKDSGIKPTTYRILAEGDLVVTHNVYENAQAFGGETLVAFDVFRIEDGKVAEHWDNLQPFATETVSGHSMVDGATKIEDLDKSADNKALVEAFINDVLKGEAPEKITDYLSTETYIQHNARVGDGLSGLADALKAMQAAGISMAYTETPLVVAEGNFVFAASRGIQADKPTAFFDLFRLSNDKIVEHWDVVADIPADMAHDNGKF